MMSFPILFTLITAPSSHAADSAIGIGFSSGALLVQRGDVIGDAVVLNPRVGYWPNENVGIELDVTLTPFGQTQVRNPDPVDYFGVLPAVNLVGRLIEDKPVNLLLNMGAGAFIKSYADNETLRLPFDGADTDFALIAGPGLMVPLGPFALRGEARWIVSIGRDNVDNNGTAFQHAQFNLGLMYLPVGPKDEDKDGVTDDVDNCPNDVEDIDTFEDADGCPDLDNDQDEILDVADTCPLEAEDKDGFADDDGCPDLDNDEDGLEDDNDRCPMQAGPEATGGCPDADQDLIADLDDECDFEPGPAASFGCVDADEDLVPDYRDECPETAAPKGVDNRRADGCGGKRAYIGQASIITVSRIGFDSRGRLTRTSKATLDDAAAILERLPAIKTLEIQIHTDSEGEDEVNLRESQEDADKIAAYLVGKGIEAARLEPKGYGESRPIADNETEEGRKQNNRVLFAILEQDEPVYEQPAPSEDDGTEGEEDGEGSNGAETPE